MEECIIVFCAMPDEATADHIATMLVEKQAAACCSIVPQIRSIYRWQDKIEAQDEFLVIIKSVAQNFTQIERIIKEHHPYDVPEILSVKAHQGHEPYLNWINQSIRVSYAK
jgi:periplasmic divalent cation tolerance protein